MAEATKTFLAVFLGSQAAMEKFRQKPEVERKELEKKGMAAWKAWAEKHHASIAQMGGPLGKIKQVSKKGIADVSNEMGAFTVVSAASHEAAAKMFEGHPHFAMFPGESVEIMEVLAIPMG